MRGQFNLSSIKFVIQIQKDLHRDLQYLHSDLEVFFFKEKLSFEILQLDSKDLSHNQGRNYIQIQCRNFNLKFVVQAQI